MKMNEAPSTEEIKALVEKIPADERSRIMAQVIASQRLQEGIKLYHQVRSDKSGQLCGCGSFHETVDTAKRVHNMNDTDCELWKMAVNARAAVEAILGYEESEGRLAAMAFVLGLVFTEVVEQSGKDFGITPDGPVN